MSKIINQLKQLSTFTSHPNFPRPSCSRSTGPRNGRWFRSLTLGLLLTFSILTIQSCGFDIEDPTPPSPPVWVQKSLPEEWPERGIDAHESGRIYLEWFGNLSEENVQTYILKRAQYFDSQDSLGEYELLLNLESGTESVIEFIDRSSISEIRYYYVLISEDASGNTSLPSDTLSYLLINFENSASMQPNGREIPLNSERELRWVYFYKAAMENYVVTILDVEDNLLHRQELLPSDYTGGWEYFTIPDTVALHSGTVYKWRVDMGAKYVDGRETAGSESNWAMFLYEGD